MYSKKFPLLITSNRFLLVDWGMNASYNLALGSQHFMHCGLSDSLINTFKHPTSIIGGDRPERSANVNLDRKFLGCDDCVWTRISMHESMKLD
jgi:hypothetical protein